MERCLSLPQSGTSRSPRGERGLKYQLRRMAADRRVSLPSRGAWIEMLSGNVIPHEWYSRSPRGERGLKYEIDKEIMDCFESLPSRGAWIEMFAYKRGFDVRYVLSLPSRGAWIEMRHVSNSQP